ncbi:MAG: zinc dependent phospholipase C family protein [Anaerolineales bacterium]|nr:zinc dependent phospholipase C family protein [Anaerolineales bacterium]
MPTPFYHLSLAQEILYHPELPAATRTLLERNLGAFLLGNVAPDVQVVSGQPRAETHFFDLPLKSNALPPWQQMLKIYPNLLPNSFLSEGHQAFLIGYLCHLQSDWRWVQQIFVPVFGLHSSWGTFEQRLVYHNVLRAYLDEQILPNLQPQWGKSLELAYPYQWLPFVEDRDLIRWRDLIAEQLKPGSKIATAEMFAARQGLQVDEFVRLVHSPNILQEVIFSRLPLTQLSAFRFQVVAENVRLVQEYLPID